MGLPSVNVIKYPPWRKFELVLDSLTPELLSAPAELLQLEDWSPSDQCQ